MATTQSIHPAAAGSSSSSAPATQSHVLHAVHTWLRYLFTAVPIIAGADKFTNLLAQWDVYLNPLALRIVPVSASTFMHIVGAIEIVAGILVFLRPRIGGYVVMGWLLAIALQLLAAGQFLDIAVRDVVIALSGAWVLARLSPLVSPASARNAG
ncbi:MAG TPA: tRNA (5-methylaminomethyl-2-thiouridylate)-methyltransferase [Opitutus sp.]|nr:tRNA (5-methylaminomethyl-2-thiouridylate)-methyltransferase [Opitutus sp.]